MSDDQTALSANRGFATKIVAAYVRRHQIGADQIGSLISTVHQALAGVSAGAKIPHEAAGQSGCAGVKKPAADGLCRTAAGAGG